jgi:hypothetical protein
MTSTLTAVSPVSTFTGAHDCDRLKNWAINGDDLLSDVELALVILDLSLNPLENNLSYLPIELSLWLVPRTVPIINLTLQVQAELSSHANPFAYIAQIGFGFLVTPQQLTALTLHRPSIPKLYAVVVFNCPLTILTTEDFAIFPVLIPALGQVSDFSPELEDWPVSSIFHCLQRFLLHPRDTYLKVVVPLVTFVPGHLRFDRHVFPLFLRLYH